MYSPIRKKMYSLLIHYFIIEPVAVVACELCFVRATPANAPTAPNMTTIIVTFIATLKTVLTVVEPLNYRKQKKL